MNLLLQVVAITVHDGVNHRLADGHPDLVQVLFFEPGLLSNLQDQTLGGVDAIKGGFHGSFHTSRSTALIIWHIFHGTAARWPSRMFTVEYSTRKCQARD